MLNKLTRSIGLGIAAIFFISALESFGQEIPAGGQILVAGDIATSGSFYSNNTSDGIVATRATVDVEGQAFPQATRIDVLNPTGTAWSSALRGTNVVDVQDGDVVLLHLFMRTIRTTSETGTASCQVYVEGPSPDYTKSISQQIFAGTEWVEWFLPFEVVGSYVAGQFNVNFGFGASERPETFELGGIEVIHYGKSRTLAEMPRTSFQYDGRAPDSPWRIDAAKRIEQYRKGNYDLRVLNKDGLPVPGASIRVKLENHAFHFGTAFPASLVFGNPTFRSKLLELFNAGSTENDLKWPPWDGEWGSDFNRPQTLAALEHLHDAGLHLRGHVLVWPSNRNLPGSIRPLVDARDPGVPEQVLAHIEDVVVPTREFLQEWDVLNEPFDNNDLMNIYGDEVMIDWFEEARSLHPSAKLFINDYAIIAANGTATEHQNHYEDTIRYLVGNGAPVDGMGMQGHFSASPTGITKAWSILNRFADAFPGLAIKITEFDVDTDDEELQADYTRDFLTLIFSHPAATGFQFWGFWEGAHWRPKAAMYRMDWEEKPNAVAYRTLVQETWQTDETRSTGTNGRVLGRGFLGTYDVEITIDGRTFNESIVIEAGGTTKDLVVDVPINGAPAITAQLLGTTVAPGETVRLSFEAFGHPAPEVHWYKNDVLLGTSSNNFLEIANAGTADEAVYHAVISNSLGSVSTRKATLGVRIQEDRIARFANISTRGKVGVGTNIMIAGFVIDGAGTKDIVIRGIGPRLESLGVSGALSDPKLDLFAAGTTSPLASNDDWDPSIAPTFTELGAFSLEGDTKSSALRVTLDAGSYTGLFSGVGGNTGVGIIEVYDEGTASDSKLVNISTRGSVGTSDSVVIAGFVVLGEVPQRVLIRGVGPTLVEFGVNGTVSDPTITLHEAIPSGTRMLAFNDDWGNTNNPMAIADTAAQVGAFPLDDFSTDACLLVDLEPGSYTVHVSDRAGSTGAALAEIYLVE